MSPVRSVTHLSGRSSPQQERPGETPTTIWALGRYRIGSFDCQHWKRNVRFQHPRAASMTEIMEPATSEIRHRSMSALSGATSRRLIWSVALAAGLAVVGVYFHTRAKREAALPQQTATVVARPMLAAPKVYDYEIVHEYPHDAEASTQGLLYRDGFLYESTGSKGQSSLRKVRLETGEVVQRRGVDDRYLGEGLTECGGRLEQLTPLRTKLTLTRLRDVSSVVAAVRFRLGVNLGYTYDLASFEPQSTFTYSNEGWGLTHDDRRLIMSDGTSELRFLDPNGFKELGRRSVTDRGQPVNYLNELEFVNREVYANVFAEDRIAIIHPDSGQVTGWINMARLESQIMRPPLDTRETVLNGIAYDVAGSRLFVTGQRWPRLFEIRLRPR